MSGWGRHQCLDGRIRFYDSLLCSHCMGRGINLPDESYAEKVQREREQERGGSRGE